MIVWIVNPYGTLPGEGWQEYRSSLLARALSRAEHRTVWWISNFEHRSKRYRTSGVERLTLDPRTEVRILPSTAYAGHASLARIRYEQRFGAAFVANAEFELRPDVVIMAEPALFFGRPIDKWCRRAGVPLVVDVLDLWPELFGVMLPRFVRPLARTLFVPLYARRAAIMRRAAGIVAVCRAYLEPADSAGAICPTAVCYLGVPASGDDQPSRFVESLPERRPGETWFVYAGTFGEAYDLATVVRAIGQVLCATSSCKFVFVGAGPRESELRALAAAHRGDVFFGGSLPANELPTLYRRCDVGISSYAVGSTVAMPVKFFDYLGGGLAVVTSLSSECGRLVDEHSCGVRYVAGDSMSLRDALLRLASAPAEVDRFRGASRRLAATFDANAQHDSYVQFIETLLTARNGGEAPPRRYVSARSSGKVAG